MTLENIIEESKELLTEQFEKGVGLRGTPLKRFSGPTLENWSEKTIKSIIQNLRESILMLILSGLKTTFLLILKDWVMKDWINT